MAVGDILLFPPAARTGQRALLGPKDIESQDSAEPIFTVGGLYENAGKVYMYVKFDNGAGNVAAVRGQACYVDTAMSWSPHTGVATVTSDVSDAVPANTLAICVGVFVNAITDGNYGFIQVAGVHVDALNSAAAAGDRLIVTTTDGSLDNATAGGDIVEYVGIALEIPA